MVCIADLKNDLSEALKMLETARENIRNRQKYTSDNNLDHCSIQYTSIKNKLNTVIEEVRGIVSLSDEL